MICLYACCDVPGNWDMRVAILAGDRYHSKALRSCDVIIRVIKFLRLTRYSFNSQLSTVQLQQAQYATGKRACRIIAYLKSPCWACVIPVVYI